MTISIPCAASDLNADWLKVFTNSCFCNRFYGYEKWPTIYNTLSSHDLP